MMLVLVRMAKSSAAVEELSIDFCIGIDGDPFTFAAG
jgi:hypothetical protein